jgi:hypothetical protein
MAGEDWTPPGGSTHVFRVPTYDDAADAPNAFKEFATSIDGGLGLDFEADREGQVVQSLDGVDWAAGMALTVSETVPDDSVGEIGDVVFVTGDDDLKGSGAGSAVVSGHNGATVQKNVSIGGDTYDLYTFTDDTRNDLSLTVGSAGLVDILLVGGGGGGGRYYGSGGGAGGMTEIMGAYLPSGPVDVRVGSGGPGANGINLGSNTGYNGSPSLVGDYLAPGGGAGVGSHLINGSTNVYKNRGQFGGSGGGAAGGPLGSAVASLGVPGFGNEGGLPSTDGSAGGGGAGTAGGDASGNTAGAGGDGRETTFTGQPMTLAGGGGGAAANGGPGGSGGGGNGGNSGVNTPGDTNTGSGGGGADGHNAGSNGGSGIVIVRVKV